MVWTQEYQLFVLCDHPGESSLQKDLLATDDSTTQVVVIFRVKWRVSSDDDIYASRIYALSTKLINQKPRPEAH